MLPSIVGLVVAWVGVALATRISTIARGQLALWSIFVSVPTIALPWEQVIAPARERARTWIGLPDPVGRLVSVAPRSAGDDRRARVH